jgi:glycosyltransferase involved in cell wall biosynthesis
MTLHDFFGPTRGPPEQPCLKALIRRTSWKITGADFRFAQSESRERVLVRAGQQGLAGAITYGWAHADADLLGVIDADLQYPLELLPTLTSNVLSGCNIAIASR